LLDEAEKLAADLRSLPGASQTPGKDRALGEALMEDLFAVEGKAMSLRLSHYASDHRFTT
jgi:hypothetical protein